MYPLYVTISSHVTRQFVQLIHFSVLLKRRPVWLSVSRWLLFRWRNVVVEAEEVRRVVAGFYSPEPVPGRPWIGIAHPRYAIRTQEIDVNSLIPLAQSI